MASIFDIIKNAALSKGNEIVNALKTQASKPVLKPSTPIVSSPTSSSSAVIAKPAAVPKYGYGTISAQTPETSNYQPFNFTPTQTKDYNFYSGVAGGNLSPDQNKQFFDTGSVDFTNHGATKPVTPAPSIYNPNKDTYGNISHSSPLLVALGLQQPDKPSGIGQDQYNARQDVAFNKPSPLATMWNEMPNLGDLLKNTAVAGYHIVKPLADASTKSANDIKLAEPRLYNEIDDPKAVKTFKQAQDASNASMAKTIFEGAKFIDPTLRGMTKIAPALSETAGIFGQGVKEKLDPLISQIMYYNPKYVAGNISTSALQAGGDILSSLFTGKDVRKNIADSSLSVDQQDMANTAYDVVTNLAGAGIQRKVSGPRPSYFDTGEQNMTEVLGAKGGQKGIPIEDIIAPGIGTKPLKERGLVTSIKNAANIAPEVKAAVTGEYKQMSLKQNEAQAQLKLNTMGIGAAHEYLMKKEYATPEDNALARALVKQYSSEGRYEDAVKIAEDAAKKATTAGQASASLKMWSDLGPEGIVNYANKLMADANEKLGAIDKMINKRFGKEYGFSDAEKADFLKKAQDLSSMKDGKEKMKATQDLLSSITTKLPFGINDAIDNYRYNNMLSNPATQLRNIYGNALQTFITKPLTDVVAGSKDAFTSWLTGSDRQKYAVDVIPYYGRALSAIPKGVGEFIKTLRGENPILQQDLAPQDMANMATQRQYKPKGAIERALTLDGIPTKTAEAMDRMFGSIMQSAEIPRFMKRFGMDEVQAKEAAQQESNYYLFRNRTDATNKTGQGYILSAIDGATNAVDALRKNVPGAKWFVPFLKTPMNVAKQWVEYSPLGLATLPGSKDKGGQLSKALAGSMFTMYGAMKAANGDVTWDSPTDPEQKKLFYATGKKPYSVRVGDKWVPLQYFGPFALAMGIPAAVKYHSEDSTKALSDDYYTKVSKIAGSAMQFFSQQTFMSGLGNFVKAAEGDQDVTGPASLGFTAGQFIPASGLLRFIANVTDPTRRSSKTFSDAIEAGIPLLKDKLEPITNPDGSVATKDPYSSLLYEMGKVNDSFQPALDARINELQLSSLRTSLINHAETLASDSIREAGTIPMGQLVDLRKEVVDNAAKPSDQEVEKAISKDITGSKYGGLTKEEVANEILMDNMTTARRSFNSNVVDKLVDLGAIYTDDVHRKELKNRIADIIDDQIALYSSDGDANAFIDKTLDKLETKWNIKL